VLPVQETMNLFGIINLSRRSFVTVRISQLLVFAVVTIFTCVFIVTFALNFGEVPHIRR
jgi:hypothetical protein